VIGWLHKCEANKSGAFFLYWNDLQETLRKAEIGKVNYLTISGFGFKDIDPLIIEKIAA
jgi:hypothetical protein